jgi:hypothetical protein
MLAQIILIIVSVLLIATSSIALECYLKNESFVEESAMRSNSKTFLIIMIVTGVLGVVGGGVSFAFQNPAYTRY